MTLRSDRFPLDPEALLARLLRDTLGLKADGLAETLAREYFEEFRRHHVAIRVPAKEIMLHSPAGFGEPRHVIVDGVRIDLDETRLDRNGRPTVKRTLDRTPRPS